MPRRKRDRSKFRAAQAQLMHTLTVLDGLELRIGIAPEEGAAPKRGLRDGGTREVEAEINVATAARANEFGTAKIPARPAFRTMARSKLTRLAVDRFAAALRQTFDTKGKLSDGPVIKAATSLGHALAELLQTTLENWALPPNAPRTVRDKGFNAPLTATGQTQESISAQIIVRRKRRLRVFADGRTS